MASSSKCGCAIIPSLSRCNIIPSVAKVMHRSLPISFRVWARPIQFTPDFPVAGGSPCGIATVYAAHRAAATGRSFAAVNAPRGRRFVHNDFAKTGTKRLKFLPEPRGHVFDRRVLESRDFVEIGVIELLHEGFHGRADFGMIVKPAGGRIDLAFHGDFDFETMAVHPAALMAFWRFR